MGGVVNLKTSIEVFRKHRTKVSAVMKVLKMSPPSDSVKPS